MKRRPNIIVLVMDTARKKSMSLYGYGRPTTPNLDRFSAGCVVYENAISPSPWTVPAHASLFSGLYPSQHGLHSANLRHWKRDYDLPGMLRRAGYRTYGCSANSLVGDTLGFSDSFDRFERLWQRFQVDGGCGAMEHPCFSGAGGEGGPARRLPAFTEHPAGFVRAAANKLLDKVFGGVLQDASPSTARGFARSLEIIKGHAASRPAQPYFLFVNVLQPHEVYNPPREYRDRFAPGCVEYPGSSQDYYSGKKEITAGGFGRLSMLYDGEVAFLDACIGKWLDGLRALPGFDDSVVVLLSDHGEHIGEHGHLSHEFSLFQELINVPLMVKYPRGVKAPGRDWRLVQSQDVFPTLLELAGLDVPGPSRGSSVSLLSASRECAVSQLLDVTVWLDGLKRFRPEFDAETFPYRSSQFAYYMKAGDSLYKRVGHGDGSRQVYELNSDPGEQTDVSGTLEADTVSRLDSLAHEEMERLGFDRPSGACAGGGAHTDEAVASQLRGLGYI